MRRRGRRGPLKRVCAEEWLCYTGNYTPKRELLECRHWIRAPSDWHGPTNAVRRRCWKCAAGDLPDVLEDDQRYARALGRITP